MKACPQCHLRYPEDAVFCFLDGVTLAEIQDPLIGTTIAGRYVIERVIGEGGMATVYAATHKLFDRPCAVKVMNAQMATDTTVRERFRREAKSAQSLAHPNVIEIFDQGETADGTPYIVMELLTGKTLAAIVDKSGKLPMQRAIPAMIQIARGIARAHDLGVVHRDLKPENIFVTARPDGSELVTIIDFGIARSRGDSRLTNAGELFGTPQYLAPERIVGGEAGPSVDLYALGVIFFEMTTGRLPFQASDPTTFLIKHMKERPPMARSLEPRIPLKLEALIMSLLEKDPKSRPVDAHRIEQDLVVLAQSLGIAVPREPEEDPASSRPTPEPLPPVSLQQWSKRVAVFEQMLARTQAAPARKDLEKTLGEVRRLVKELAEARDASDKTQQRLEEIDARGRDGRQRFGFAVDALGLDASKARDDVRAARAEVEKHGPAAKAAREAYAAAQREVVSWEGRSGGHEPYAQLAQAYRACANAVDAWTAARKKERAAQVAAEDKERMVADLDFQISELRAALASHEKRVDGERDAMQTQLVTLNERVEKIEAQLLQLATRFCEPLRTRPELGPYFQQLESEAAVSSGTV
jgi:serine/threonine-protein kinase